MAAGQAVESLEAVRVSIDNGKVVERRPDELSAATAQAGKEGVPEEVEVEEMAVEDYTEPVTGTLVESSLLVLATLIEYLYSRWELGSSGPGEAWRYP